MSGVVGWLERPIRFGVLIAVVLALIVAAFAAGTGLSRSTAGQAGTSSFHACVKLATGVPRIVWGPTQCTAGEYPITWSGANGLAGASYGTETTNVSGGNQFLATVTCAPGSFLLDAGYSVNPSTRVDSGSNGPTSVSAWSATLVPSNNTALTVAGSCSLSSSGGNALTAGPQITIVEIEE